MHNERETAGIQCITDQFGGNVHGGGGGGGGGRRE